MTELTESTKSKAKKAKPKKIKMAYRPVGLLFGMAAGAAAGALFSRTWQVLGEGRDAPDPLDEERSWRDVLIASALQGAIFAVARAAADRGGAAGVRRMTGKWPA
ncbi:DUF4235 domain-containing protein [Streptomyces sp. NPDC001941]|uniref:DUF4235 domain-containing protein n=1 Tax=Streptomyces sp. NPDC001941 TaxID=3154659 RepID=UPI0033222FE9